MSLYTVSIPSYNYYYGTSSSTSSTSAGLQIGFTGEYLFNKQMGIGSEFNINTQAGTPIEWATFFKMYFLIKGSDIRPYADGGFNLFFVTGGPYFGTQIRGRGAVQDRQSPLYTGRSAARVGVPDRGDRLLSGGHQRDPVRDLTIHRSHHNSGGAL